jgi:hypothetical protein
VSVTHQCANGRADGDGRHDPIAGGQEPDEQCSQPTDEGSPQSVPGRDRRHG